MMAWFDVGCIGLFTANIFALRNFTADTSIEAYELVYTTNLYALPNCTWLFSFNKFQAPTIHKNKMVILQHFCFTDRKNSIDGISRVDIFKIFGDVQ